MASTLASSAVDGSSSIGRVKQKIMKLVYVCSSLSTQHYEERLITGCPIIRIICPSGATCLPADCCFSVLALYKSN